MKRTSRGSVLPVVFVVAWLTALSGCGDPAATATRPTIPNDPAWLTIDGNKIRVEVAFDDLSRTRGLMDRESMPEDEGMLFMFPVKERRRFWMANTYIPLSIAFLDDDGTIQEIEHMKPEDRSTTWSTKESRFALEMNKGWFERHDVGVGDRIDGFDAVIERFPAR